MNRLNHFHALRVISLLVVLPYALHALPVLELSRNWQLLLVVSWCALLILARHGCCGRMRRLIQGSVGLAAVVHLWVDGGATLRALEALLYVFIWL